jgi:hypothetical protein
MTGNFRFLDEHFPANGKPPPVFFAWTSKRRAAWWLESNRRKERGKGDLAGSQGSSTPPGAPDTPSLADEIKAARRKPRRRTGNGAGDSATDCQNLPYDLAEDAENSQPGEDSARAKHDEKSCKATYLRLSKLSRTEYELVRVKEAKELGNDFRVTTLDKEVEALGPKGADGGMQGRAMSFPEVEPWPEAVDGRRSLTSYRKIFAAMSSWRPRAQA